MISVCGSYDCVVSKPGTHDCCCIATVAEETLGGVHAQALKTLIADAEAVETAAEFLHLRGQYASVDGDDSLLADLGADYRARFVAIGQEFIRDAEGKIIWSSVRRLKLMALESDKRRGVCRRRPLSYTAECILE